MGWPVPAPKLLASSRLGALRAGTNSPEAEAGHGPDALPPIITLFCSPTANACLLDLVSWHWNSDIGCGPDQAGRLRAAGQPWSFPSLLLILLDKGHIAKEFRVDLPRPRQKSVTFAELEQQVLQAVLAT